MPISDEQLANLLTEGQFLTPKDLEKAKNLAKSEHIALYDAVVRLDLIADENLGILIADFLKFPHIVLSKVAILPEILHVIPEVVARKQKIICFGKDKDGIRLAMLDPRKKEIAQFVAKKTGERVHLYFATPTDIERALSLYKKDLQNSFEDLVKQAVLEAGKSSNPEAPVTKIVDLLIEYAYTNRASDIHIEPQKKDAVVRFRIDGVLHDVLNFEKSLHDQVISRIKVLAKLRTDEHFSAQDGKMVMSLPEEELDLRVSIVPITNGEKAVLRLLSEKSRQLSLNDLGMSEADLAKVKSGFEKPYGMVLSTGPTGSGKTTTIYTILKILNSREINIATIEDPVEYEISGVNQIQVNAKTNLTFANGLRAILRQDPNTIFVGEIRDSETAEIAINSAMTGHLVLSTLHTNDAATTLPRLIDMNIEPFLVASTVNVIIGQRLVRKICENCRTSQSMSYDELKKHLPEELIGKYFARDKDLRVYMGKGCPVCHGTGYVGRIGIFEVLVVGREIKELIVGKADSGRIEKQAKEGAMTTMLEDGLRKVQEGVTTIEEILRATKE